MNKSQQLIMFNCCQKPLDIVEIEHFNEKNLKAREYIAALKEAGKRGNALALFYLGHWYLTGVWDVKAMEDDLILGRLQPATKEVSEDPYFLLPKDPNKGLQLLKTFIHLIKTTKKSLFFRNYQLQATKLFNLYDPTINTEAHLLNAAPMNSRPEVTKNSFKRLFSESARNNMILYLINTAFGLFFFVVYGIRVYLLVEDRKNVHLWPLIGLLVVLAYLPALLMALFMKIVGVNGNQPLCSCRAMTEGFNRIMNRLPEQDRVRVQNPYESTSCFIRNSMSIFAIYFGIITLVGYGSGAYFSWLIFSEEIEEIEVPILEYCFVPVLLYFAIAGLGCTGSMLVGVSCKNYLDHAGCDQFNIKDKCPIVVPDA